MVDAFLVDRQIVATDLLLLSYYTVGMDWSGSPIQFGSCTLLTTENAALQLLFKGFAYVSAIIWPVWSYCAVWPG